MRRAISLLSAAHQQHNIHLNADFRQTWHGGVILPNFGMEQL